MIPFLSLFNTYLIKNNKIQLQKGSLSFSGVFTSWEDGLWGKVKPYNLTNVKVPVTLLYGQNDQLTQKSVSPVLANTNVHSDFKGLNYWYIGKSSRKQHFFYDTA